MPRVIKLVALGLVCVGLSLAYLATLVGLLGLFKPRLVIQVSLRRLPEDAINDFVFNDSQYCRPFLPSINPQVVRVEHRFKTPSETDEHVTNCSGVIVGPRSVLTAKHCIELPAGDLVGGTVKTLMGESFDVASRDLDPEEDIALLEVERQLNIEAPEIAHHIPMALTLVGYGCVQGEPSLPLQRAAVALAQRDHILYLAGCVCHGDSGGPIFDDDGALVALMYWTENDGKNGRGVLIQDFIERKSSRIH